MSKLIFVFLLVFFSLAPSRPGEMKSKYPKSYFRSPIDFPMLLAGSFGELRKNHFHSGIDIRTGGVEGKPVYAAADGYVSRINISSTGFGKALYITHPNGYMTVYGHLQRFNAAIGRWIRDVQYRKESFAIDTSVDPGLLKVQKGEVIAYSGNSGTSGGPHLHFEIRDAATEEIIDPLLFGMPVKDELPPQIRRIRIYPMDENSLVNFSDQPLTLMVVSENGHSRVKSPDTIRVTGNIVFGIEVVDQINESGIKEGVHTIDLHMDTLYCFSQSVDHFAFADTRYVNSLLDYPALIRSKLLIQRSYVAPNNRLTIYTHVRNHGVINFTDQRVHKIKYEVGDVYGNKTTLIFMVKSHLPPSGGRKKPGKPEETIFSCKSENHFQRDGLQFDLPQNALYEDLHFNYAATAREPRTFSRLYHLQDELTPIHAGCTLSVKPENLPGKFRNKVVIVREDTPGHFSSCGGRWENDFVTTSIREFGNFTIMVDTTPPVIKPVNIAPGKIISGQGTIRLKISDNLSGIKSYRGTLNGKWILMDYDAKSSLLTYTFDGMLKPGKNSFNLVVRDDVGNESIYSCGVVR